MYLCQLLKSNKWLFDYVSKNEIKYLDMTFEEASRFIVSAGTSENKNNN